MIKVLIVSKEAGFSEIIRKHTNSIEEAIVVDQTSELDYIYPKTSGNFPDLIILVEPQATDNFIPSLSLTEEIPCPLLFWLNQHPSAEHLALLYQNQMYDYVLKSAHESEIQARFRAAISFCQKHKSLQEHQATLAEQRGKLTDLKNEQNYLMSIVAHDLKAPLNKVLGLTQLMPIVGTLNSEQENYVGMINKVLEGGRKLIDDILTISAYESYLDPIHVEKIRLKEYLSEIVASYQQQTTGKNIDIHVEVGEQVSVHTDKESLYRILDNLLSNAIKFSPKGKDVHLTAEHHEDHLLIAVKDEGPGISHHDQKKMFKKFQKLSNKPTAGENSTGLGLSIVKVLVEKLEGEIYLDSKLGEGTTFYVRLPFLEER